MRESNRYMAPPDGERYHFLLFKLLIDCIKRYRGNRAMMYLFKPHKEVENYRPYTSVERMCSLDCLRHSGRMPDAPIELYIHLHNSSSSSSSSSELHYTTKAGAKVFFIVCSSTHIG